MLFFNKFVAKIANYVTKRTVEASKSETIELVVDLELKGVTPEMIDWWWDHIDTTERYKLWHPRDHKSFKWEVSPMNGHVGTVQLIIEKIGRISTMMRIRWEDPKSVPISTIYSHVLAGSIIDKNYKPYSWLVHEYEEIPTGARIKSTFKLPAKTPQWFLRALREHNIEEISQFQEFLPSLFEKNKNGG
jgi:hypothetical protein